MQEAYELADRGDAEGYNSVKVMCNDVQNLLRREWVGLMRGVRVEGNSVIITVNGNNDEARFLCKELINEMTIHKEKT
jgi:hydroxymethylglutaryl-CoA reductase